MGFIVLAIIGFIGSQAEKLRWQPFALIAALAIPGLWLKVMTSRSGLEALGDSTDHLSDPVFLASNWLFSAVLWSAIYLIGFGIGKLLRRGKSRNRDLTDHD